MLPYIICITLGILMVGTLAVCFIKGATCQSKAAADDEQERILSKMNDR